MIGFDPDALQLEKRRKLPAATAQGYKAARVGLQFKKGSFGSRDLAEIIRIFGVSQTQEIEESMLEAFNFLRLNPAIKSLMKDLIEYAGIRGMRVTGPVRLNPSDAKLFTKGSFIANPIDGIGVSESSVDVEDH
jgi:hypothetical protein